jgi:uncharacterized membrane protein (UPF0127 family)
MSNYKKLLTATLVFLLPLHAQALAKRRIRVGNQTVTAEVADTEGSRTQGLMHRKHLDAGTGMLFIFENAEKRYFWMKNTLIPLSIAYFDSQKKLINIVDMEPASPIEVNPKTYASTGPAKYALEVPKGWFIKVGIKVGDKLEILTDKTKN